MRDGHEATPDTTQAPAGAGFEWLRTFGTVSPVGIFTSDVHARCMDVNGRWCELSGLSREEALGDGWKRAIHPGDRERLFRDRMKAYSAGQPFHAEFRYLRPDGSVVHVLGQIEIQCDFDGRIQGFVGAVTDITELHRMREDLLRSRAGLEAKVRERTQKLLHMAMVVEAIDDAIVVCDFEGRIVSWNKAAETMFGWRACEILGKGTHEITPERLWDEAQEIKARARRGLRTERYETVRRKKNGDPIEVSLSLFPLRDAMGRIVGTSAILRDITERKKSEQHLRQLSWRLLQAQDDERRRIARDLHDSTAQLVAAVKGNLTQLELPAKALPAARRRALVTDAVQLADMALRELRSISYLLHPPLLDERGLPPALAWLVNGFTKRSGIQASLEIAPDVGRLPEGVEIVIYRVVQESLANVLRHSQSPTAAIHLTRDAAGIVLEVSDCGRGLPEQSGHPPGVGISSMKERLLHLGGSLRIESREPGMAIIARLPLIP